jgi:SAM-dependent methyltransferase
MPTIKSTNYHDYVIKDGQFIGEFEQMYQHVDDPWGCVSKSASLYNDLLLALVKHVTPERARILEAGCGLGALAARIQETVPSAQVMACDVSATAIDKARGRYPGIEFFVQDLAALSSTPITAGSLDVVTLSQVLWCVLPQMRDVLREFHRLLAPKGVLVVLQQFYDEATQKYGRGIVEAPDDFIRWVREAGFEIEQEIYVNRERPLNLVLAARKRTEGQQPTANSSR